MARKMGMKKPVGFVTVRAEGKGGGKEIDAIANERDLKLEMHRCTA